MRLTTLHLPDPFVKLLQRVKLRSWLGVSSVALLAIGRATYATAA
jgi:hypothetical protein